MMVSTATIFVTDGPAGESPVALLRCPGDDALAPSLDRLLGVLHVATLSPHEFGPEEVVAGHVANPLESARLLKAEQGNAKDGASARLLEDWAPNLMVGDVLADEHRRRMTVLVAADMRLVPTVRTDLTMEVHHETNIKTPVTEWSSGG